MYTIVTPRHFLRRAAKLFGQHPELRERFRQVMEMMRADPYQPQLRLHPFRGELDGMHAVSLTYGYRILLILLVTEHEIILQDIGSHDEVYR